jgi:hypothetical protein
MIKIIFPKLKTVLQSRIKMALALGKKMYAAPAPLPPGLGLVPVSVPYYILVLYLCQGTFFKTKKN